MHAQTNCSQVAAVVDMGTCESGEDIVQLLANINKAASGNSVFSVNKRVLRLLPCFEWVHGAKEEAPSVAVWIPPQSAAHIAKVDHYKPKWVHKLCKDLVKLRDTLPEWTTEISDPAVLFYPTPDQLKVARALGVHINLQHRDQVVHLDQAPGCHKATNFCVPSKNRPFTSVYRVSEREFLVLARAKGDGLLSALNERGKFETDLLPDGMRALTFSGGTPHYGTGGNDAKQSSMIFFSGLGSAAHLTKGEAVSVYHTGQTASGEGRGGCDKDAVFTVGDAREFIPKLEAQLEANGKLGSSAVRNRDFVGAFDGMC
jgi:hypothetical protein